MIDVLILTGTFVGICMVGAGFRRICDFEMLEDYYYGWFMFWAGLVLVGIGLAAGVWDM